VYCAESPTSNAELLNGRNPSLPPIAFSLLLSSKLRPLILVDGVSNVSSSCTSKIAPFERYRELVNLTTTQFLVLKDRLNTLKCLCLKRSNFENNLKDEINKNVEYYK
jgi:hypothetical protein